MDISVIICTFNRSESLHKVLEDLHRQHTDRRVSFEVIIVDNNSKDATKEICEEFVNIDSKKFRYIHEEKQGKTFALNTGIRSSKGTIIAFTDDDVVIGERWVSSIKQACEANSSCKAFGGRVIPVWPNTVPKWIVIEGAFKNIGGAIVEHDLGKSVKSYLQTGTLPIGANMFFVRDIFETYGGFNEELNQGVKEIPMLEDTEFCYRLFKNNENITYIPDSIVYHPVDQERLTRNYFRKHAFKSGRAQCVINELKKSGQYVLLSVRKNRRIVCNVPLYLLRNIVANLLKYCVATIKRRPDEVIYFEKFLIISIGTIYELLTAKWRQSPRY